MHCECTKRRIYKLYLLWRSRKASWTFMQTFLFHSVSPDILKALGVWNLLLASRKTIFLFRKSSNQCSSVLFFITSSHFFHSHFLVSLRLPVNYIQSLASSFSSLRILRTFRQSRGNKWKRKKCLKKRKNVSLSLFSLNSTRVRSFCFSAWLSTARQTPARGIRR